VKFTEWQPLWRMGTTVAMGHVLEMPIQNRDVFSLVNLVPGGLFKASAPSNACIGPRSSLVIPWLLIPNWRSAWGL